MKPWEEIEQLFTKIIVLPQADHEDAFIEAENHYRPFIIEETRSLVATSIAMDDDFLEDNVREEAIAALKACKHRHRQLV